MLLGCNSRARDLGSTAQPVTARDRVSSPSRCPPLGRRLDAVSAMEPVLAVVESG
jgi:hypothetical protein